MVKLLPFHKTFIFCWINLKTIFLTKSFNKTLWLPYWSSYIIDLTCFLFVYIPTHPPIHLPIHLFIYLPTYPHVHLPTYHLHDVMSTNVWNTKYEGTALNELTTILIIFDPLMLINDNLECQYYTFNQLLWPTCRYCMFWWLLLEVKIVEELIAKYNTHIWKQCHFKYNRFQ